jgi:hypothetical protein
VLSQAEIDCYVTIIYSRYVTKVGSLMALTNAERQKRFRELTLRERQLKADAFDLLLSILECDLVREDTIPLPDGRSLKVIRRRDGKAMVEIAGDPQRQRAMERARLHLLHGD